MVKLAAASKDDNEGDKKDVKQTVELTESGRIAPACPVCGSTDTEVYTTRGSVRYCRCREPECAARFKVSKGQTHQINLAGPCPTNPKHDGTRVYRTIAGVNYCICDDCGGQWKRPVQKPKKGKG